MKKVTILLISITLISRATGLLNDLALTYFFGANDITDAYLIALTIPTSFFFFLGDGIVLSYIPIYQKIVTNKGKNQANKFTSNVVSLMLLISIVIIVVIQTCPQLLVHIFASGFDENTTQLTVGLLKIISISVVAMGMTSVFQGYLNAEEVFLIPSIMGIVKNLIVIIFIVVSSYLGFHYLAYGNIVACFAQLIVICPILIKMKYRYNPSRVLLNRDIQNIIKLAIPITFSTSISQINKIIDRTLASNLLVGGVSALTYANKINLLFEGIFISTILSVRFPRLAKLVSENKDESIRNETIDIILIISFLVIPSSIILIGYSEEIVRILFGRGAFQSEQIVYTSRVLLLYSMGLFFIALRSIFVRIFYSFQDTRTPVKNSVVGVAINIVLNIILSHFIGIYGLALATTISGVIVSGLLGIKLQQKIGKIFDLKILKELAKISLLSIMMIGVIMLTNACLTTVILKEASLIFSFVIGGIAYLGASYSINLCGIRSFIK